MRPSQEENGVSDAARDPKPVEAAGRAPTACRIVVTVALAALLVTLLWLAQGPVTMARGSVFDDAYVLLAADHFAEDGFLRCAFLPVVQPGPLADPPDWYTHQPPGPYIVAGVERKLGVASVQGLRTLPVVLTVLSLAFLYALTERLFGGPLALAATLFAATTPALLYWADALDSYSYDAFFLAATMFCWIRAVTSEGRTQRRFAVLAWLGAFGQSLFSFMFIPFTQVFIWGSAFALGWRGRKRRLLLFLAAPVVGVGLHFAQNAVALGGAGAAFDDFRGAFLQRTVEADTADRYLRLAEYPLRLVDRVEHWYLHPVALLALFLLAARLLAESDGREAARRFVRMSLVLAVAGSVWWIVFAEHSWIHHVTIRQYLPLVAWVLGGALVGLVRLARRKDALAGVRAAAALLVVLVVGWQAARFVTYAAAQREAGDFAAPLAPVKAMLPSDAVVLTNHGNHPMLAYLLDRRVERSHELLADALDAIECDPDRDVCILQYAPGGANVSDEALRWQAIAGDDARTHDLGEYILYTP